MNGANRPRHARPCASGTIIAGACGSGSAERLAPLLSSTARNIAYQGPAAFGAAEPNGLFSSADGAILVAADARIDDRAALLVRLGLTGASSTGALSNAAIIAHAWARWGENAPQELLGDYGFAVFDRRIEALWLVRDALGFRPLSFVMCGSISVFCSLPSRLATDAGISKLAIACALPSRTTPLTWFEGVEQVQPGETVRLGPRAVTREFWWQPSTSPSFDGSREDLQSKMRAALEAAVADRIGGVTRIASHLSAGLDSMAVTVTAADLLPTGSRIEAITARPIPGVELVRPAGRIVDESASAARVAERFPNLRHRVVDAAGRSISDDVTSGAGSLDQPLTNLFNFGWFAASCDAALNAGATRLLVAQQGNYGLSALAGDYWWPLLRREGVTRFLTAWREAGSWRGPPGELSRRLRTGNAPARADMWLEILRSIDPGLFLKGFARRGLEVLDPTADRRIIELALTVPQNLLVRNGDERWLVREMLRGRVPDDILDESRRGFQSADWLSRLRAEAKPLVAMLDRAAISGGGSFDESRTLLLAIESRFDERLDQRAKSDLARDLAIAGFLVSQRNRNG